MYVISLYAHVDMWNNNKSNFKLNGTENLKNYLSHCKVLNCLQYCNQVLFNSCLYDVSRWLLGWCPCQETAYCSPNTKNGHLAQKRNHFLLNFLKTFEKHQLIFLGTFSLILLNFLLKVTFIVTSHGERCPYKGNNDDTKIK